MNKWVMPRLTSLACGLILAARGIAGEQLKERSNNRRNAFRIAEVS